MAESANEKTEAPTPRRVQQQREEGHVARSMDLTGAAILLASVLLVYWLGGHMVSALRVTVRVLMGESLGNHPTRMDDVGAMAKLAGEQFLSASAPLMVALFVVGILATVVQTGLVLTSKPLELDFQRLSPLRGFRNLFDARAGMRLAMSLAKLVVIGLVTMTFVMMDVDRIMLMGRLGAAAFLPALGELLYGLSIKLAVLLVLLGVADYVFQRWKHLQDIRMTREEVKEEHKRMEGDPLIKQRRARVARQLAMQRISQAVPKADVVVTNPTHFAVALRYESVSMSAPKVVAKGADFMAMRIRQLAVAHDVPLVERRELARGLYQSVEIGQEVPPEFYSAVAEILAYVYRLGGRRSA